MEASDRYIIDGRPVSELVEVMVVLSSASVCGHGGGKAGDAPITV